MVVYDCLIAVSPAPLDAVGDEGCVVPVPLNSVLLCGTCICTLHMR